MTPERVQFKFAVVLLALSVLTPPLCAAGGNNAQTAFGKLQSLEGQWEGKDQKGKPVRSYFSPIASNTAVMETLTTRGDEMVSVYSRAANSIILVHYSAQNNQPLLRALPSSGTRQKLVFTFEEAENLPHPDAGHEYSLTIEFKDGDHITERWTWREDGKDTDSVFHLERLHLSRN
ncbi:MAG TPA: hypothetical protein VGR48_09530 [Terriglobales bacterium]|nr:hypothetical protein [Terriglobales bacterium]